MGSGLPTNARPPEDILDDWGRLRVPVVFPPEDDITSTTNPPLMLRGLAQVVVDRTDLSCTLFGVAVARSAYRLLITLFVLGVVVQFYLAGAGVFRAHGPGKAVDSSAFDPHRTLGDVLIILSVLVLLAALVGRNGRWMFALALVVLMVVALFVAHASSWGGAFHPVIGLLVFGISGSMAGVAWRAHRAAAPGAS